MPFDRSSPREGPTPTLGSWSAAACPLSRRWRVILSQAWALLQSITGVPCNPVHSAIPGPKDSCTLCTRMHLPRFAPLRRFSSCSRAILTTGFHIRRPGDAHRVSHPLDAFPAVAYRAYFIPNPPLGFSLRGFAPAMVSYAVSHAASLLALARQRVATLHLQGLAHHRKGAHGSEVNRMAANACLLGLRPFEVSWTWWSTGHYARQTVPSRAFSSRSTGE